MVVRFNAGCFEIRGLQIVFKVKRLTSDGATADEIIPHCEGFTLSLKLDWRTILHQQRHGACTLSTLMLQARKWSSHRGTYIAQASDKVLVQVHW